MKSLSRLFSPTSFGCVAVLAAFMIPGCPPVNPVEVKLELQAIGEELPFEWEQGSVNFAYRVPGNQASEFSYDTYAYIVFDNQRDPDPAFDETKFELEFAQAGVSVLYQLIEYENYSDTDRLVRGSDNEILTRIRKITDPTHAPSITAYLRIDPSLPARPIYITVRGTTRDGRVVYSKTYPLYVRRDGAGPAPRLNQLTVPAQIFRGTQVPITVTGSIVNSIAGGQFVMEDAAGIAVLSPTYDAGTKTLSATLDVKPDAQTGYSAFYLETPAGGSTDYMLNIVEPRPLRVDEVYPNYAVQGPRSEFALAGDFLHTGMSVVSVPDDAFAIPSPPVVADRHNAKILLQVDTLRAGPVLKTSGTGGTDLVALPQKPRGFRGPRITRVSPQQIVAGTRGVQLQVEGEHFDVNVPTGFGALLNEAVGELFLPLDGRRVLPRSSLATHRVVLLAQPDAMARPGPFDLFLATAGGLTTNVVRMELVAPPAAPQPFAARAQIGRIARDGAARLDTILGERLTGVRRVDSRTPGLEVVGFTEKAGGTALDVMVRAMPTTPLTGDARTVFTVITNHGTSNDVGYLVEDSGATPGGPQIDALFPNWVAEGGASVQWVHGANFTAASKIEFEPANAVILHPDPNLAGRFIDALNIERGFAFSNNATGSLNVRVVTPGVGQSSAVPLEILDRSSPTGPYRQGPFANYTDPDQIVGGARSQILIYGAELVDGGTTTVVGLRNASGELIAAGTFYPIQPGSALTHEGVLELQTDELPAATPSPAPAFFALRRGDGLTSEPLEMQIERALATGPFVVRATPLVAGDFQRGTTRTMRILGRGLTGATSVDFNTSTGVSIPTTPGAITVIDDTELHVDFIAEPTADLTGNAITTFQVTTPAGFSNEASFILLP